MVALLAPFVPDPDAEISLLATAIIPILLASVVWSARRTLILLARILVIGAIQLSLARILELRERNTGVALSIVVVVAGGLIILLRRHTQLLEDERLGKIHEGHSAWLNSERERLEYAARFHLLFETALDGIFVADESQRFVEVNEAAGRQLGYTRAELLQLTIRDVSTRTSEDRSRLLAAVDDVGHVVIETRQRRKDGTIVPVELAVTRTEFHGRPAYLGISRDLTERLRTEEEKSRLMGQLHHAMKMESIGRLAGGVAHDFNNLLTAILGNAELALERLEDRTALREHLLNLQNAGRSGAALTC